MPAGPARPAGERCCAPFRRGAERAASGVARARASRARMHAAAPRAAHALEQLLRRRSRGAAVGATCCGRSASQRHLCGVIGRHDRTLAAQPAAARQLFVLPARRSAGQDRSLHDGQLARGALAVPRSRADRVRRRRCPTPTSSTARRDQGDPARRVHGPDPAPRSIGGPRPASACRSTPGSAASCASWPATLLLSPNARYRDLSAADVVQRTLSASRQRRRQRRASGCGRSHVRALAAAASRGPFRSVAVRSSGSSRMIDASSLAAVCLLSFAACRVAAGAAVPRWPRSGIGYVANPREDRWHRRPVALLGGVGDRPVAVRWSSLRLRRRHRRCRCCSIVRAADVRRRPGRRRHHAQAVDQADRADRAGVGAAVLRLPAQLARVADARQPADAGLGRRADQRLQPARQHGRAVRRHRADRRRRRWLVDLLPGATGAHASAEVRYLAILLGATGGFLVYNFHPASIFMGDSGSLLLGFSLAAADAEHRAADAAAGRTSCRSSRRRCWCC